MSLTKITGSGAGSLFGSVSQRYGSADPDPYENVTDPQQWREGDHVKSPKLILSSILSTVADSDLNRVYEDKNCRRNLILCIKDLDSLSVGVAVCPGA
jgi:hypothetical protein